MAGRRRRVAEVSPQVQKIIDEIDFDSFQLHKLKGTLGPYVQGYVGWALKSIHKRADGSSYSGASPFVVRQVKLWVKQGCQYGGKRPLASRRKKKIEEQPVVKRRKRNK